MVYITDGNVQAIFVVFGALRLVFPLIFSQEQYAQLPFLSAVQPNSV